MPSETKIRKALILPALRISIMPKTFVLHYGALQSKVLSLAKRQSQSLLHFAVYCFTCRAIDFHFIDCGISFHPYIILFPFA